MGMKQRRFVSSIFETVFSYFSMTYKRGKNSCFIDDETVVRT